MSNTDVAMMCIERQCFHHGKQHSLITVSDLMKFYILLSLLSIEGVDQRLNSIDHINIITILSLASLTG